MFFGKKLRVKTCIWYYISYTGSTSDIEENTVKNKVTLEKNVQKFL